MATFVWNGPQVYIIQAKDWEEAFRKVLHCRLQVTSDYKLDDLGQRISTSLEDKIKEACEMFRDNDELLEIDAELKDPPFEGEVPDDWDDSP
jgi:hypothetical protein